MKPTLALLVLGLTVSLFAYAAPDPRAAGAIGNVASPAGAKDAGGAEAAEQTNHTQDQLLAKKHSKKKKSKTHESDDEDSVADDTQDRIHTGDAHPMMSARHEKAATH